MSQREKFMKDVRVAQAGIGRAQAKVAKANAVLEAARDDELGAWAALYGIAGVEAPATAHMLLDIPMSEAEAWFSKVRRREQSARTKRPRKAAPAAGANSHLAAVGE